MNWKGEADDNQRRDESKFYKGNAAESPCTKRFGRILKFGTYTACWRTGNVLVAELTLDMIKEYLTLYQRHLEFMAKKRWIQEDKNGYAET